MGVRLHVARTYKVEFADSQFFNWQIEEINNLIKNHCENSCFSYNDDYCNSDSFEVDKDDLIKLIEWLKICSVEEYETENKKLSKEYTKDEVAKNLNYCLEHSDPENDYVKFYWF